MTATRSHERSLLLSLSLVAGLSAVVSFFPIEESNDAWWHLKAGQLIWEGKLGWYDNDAFTWTSRDKVWVNHEWLAEWLFYAFYRTGSLLCAIAFKSAIIASTFLAVFFSCLFIQQPGSRLEAAPTETEGGDRGPSRFGNLLGTCAKRLPPTVMATCLAIPTSQFTFYLRPPIFTFLLVACFHLAIVRRKGEAPGWGLTAVGAVMMVLWANLHGGAILGCVILFLMGAGSVLHSLLDRFRGVRPVVAWAKSGLIICGASLVNPYGYHLHLLTFEMMSREWLTERIPELEPPPFDLMWTLPLLLIPAIVGVLRAGSWGERLVFAFLMWQGLSHVRHLPLLAIWAAPYATYTLAQVWERTGRKVLSAAVLIPPLVALCRYANLIPLAFIWNPVSLYIALVCMFAVTVFFLFRPERHNRIAFLLASAIAIGFVVTYPGDRPSRFVRALGGQSWSGARYPDQLAEFILKYNLPGPVVLNRENYSGYLIWKLAPETMRPFTCSRYDLQGSLPCMELETLLWRVDRPWRDPSSGLEIPPWEEIWDQKYTFNLVLIEKYSDRFEKTPFPLWVYLNSPESGFVNVASESWPMHRFPDQEYTLFMRKGEDLERLMAQVKRRARFEE